MKIGSHGSSFRDFCCSLFPALLICSTFFGPVFGQTPESGFLVWLMNNESRAMSVLEFDRKVIDRMSDPFGFLPSLIATGPVKAEEKIWDLNSRFYRVLPELGRVYLTARRFASGKLAPVLNKAFPGSVLVGPITGFPALRANLVGPVLDEQFRKDVLDVLGLDKGRDANLAERFQKSLASLSDTDRRLLLEYFGTFLALYPGNKPARLLESLVKGGWKKNLGEGATNLILVATGKGENIASGSSGTSFEDDPDFIMPDGAGAGEASKTTGVADSGSSPGDSGSGTVAASGGTPASGTASASVEAPDPTQVDMFNIMK